jgi:hypothetical protein
MAKFNKDKLSQCVEWVEKNGLYPQRCGAPLKDFCSAMGISEQCYRNWLKVAEFAEAIAHARDVFAEQTVVEVVNALKKKALGCEYVEKRVKKAPRKIVTYDPKTGRKIAEEQGELIVVEQSADTVLIMPDTQAAIFLLTNLDPEHWKNMQRVEQSGELKVNAEFKGFTSVLPHYPNIEQVVAEQEQNRPTEES